MVWMTITPFILYFKQGRKTSSNLLKPGAPHPLNLADNEIAKKKTWLKFAFVLKEIPVPNHMLCLVKTQSLWRDDLSIIKSQKGFFLSFMLFLNQNKTVYMNNLHV